MYMRVWGCYSHVCSVCMLCCMGTVATCGQDGGVAMLLIVAPRHLLPPVTSTTAPDQVACCLCCCALQEGSVDEVSFMAPELGPLAAIMVAPEGGSWVCDEVDVYSSRSNHTDRWVESPMTGHAKPTAVLVSRHSPSCLLLARTICTGAAEVCFFAWALCACIAHVGLCCRFVCRQRLGGRKGEPAAYLTPVPPNAVVYGTGDAARIISKVWRAGWHYRLSAALMVQHETCAPPVYMVCWHHIGGSLLGPAMTAVGATDQGHA